LNFSTCDIFSPQKPNHCTLLFFGACGKQKGHVDNASDARQLNFQGKIHHNSCADTAVGPITKKNKTLEILFGLPLQIKPKTVKGGSTFSVTLFINGMR
jgi:hypothetical protein